MADVGFRHVTKVTLFRNGDPNFNGKHIVVNPRYYRNFESFLDTATFTTQCTSAVTRICTPLGRHNIESVDQLADGGTYVAVGRETFKRLKYGQPRPRRIPARLPPVWRNHLPSSGRFRKVYEGERQALKRIFVYRNGDNITPARMILLKKRVLTDMELVLTALQDSGLDFDFAISKLFTLNGRQIHGCDEIVHDGKYVAIERGSRFKSMKYGGHGEVSPRNIMSHSLPPLAPQNNSSVHRSPKKHITKLPTITKPRPPPQPTKQEKKVPSSRQTQQTKKQRENKRSGVPNQQSIVSISQDENKDSFSNVSLSATPPPLDESPDFTLSRANKDKENGTDDEKLPEIGDIPRDIDELPKEEQESIGAHIYKASGMQREWGDMVNDSRKTPDKTLDNTPAEEVVEEIVEDTEDVTEISETTEVKVEKDNKIDEGNKMGLSEKDEDKIEEIVHEVAETLIDNDEKDGREDDKKKESNDEPVKQERSDSEASRENDDKSDEESKDEDDKDEESADDVASNDDDGDEAKVDGGKVQESVAVDNDDKKVDGIDKASSDTLIGNNENGDNKAHGDTDPVASDKDDDDDNNNDDNDNNDDDDDDDDDEDDDDKDESPAVSQNPSRRSSQEMNSEDEVKSEDEVDEEDDEKDDDDDKDEDDEEDVKSEEEDESEADKDEEDDEDDDDDKEDDDDDDDSSAASEPEDDASDTDPTSEKEDEATEENAVKQNKTNQKVEKQRAQPDISTKKGKPDMIKSRSTKTRDVNKA